MLFLAVLVAGVVALDPIVKLNISTNSTGPTVASNFLGISFELSFLDQYFGDDSNSIPDAWVSYMKALKDRIDASGAAIPMRMRVGGNAIDSSVYVANQTSPMVQLTDPNANSNNQPVNYSSEVFKALKNFSDTLGGVEYLMGLSLGNPSDPSIDIVAGAAQLLLGDSLDALLLGNEPDLYQAHRNRPKLANYTVYNYQDEWATASNQLNDTAAGNILQMRKLAGPTICCNWDLATLLQQGYLTRFNKVLKYITLQHYPQNNCPGARPSGIWFYQNHSSVVTLAQFQKPGIDIARTANGSQQIPDVLMSEFNSASCGGVPSSSSFAVGAMWTLDYALQMAAVGYSAAFLHTRERGVSYNIVQPPSAAGESWATNTPYYALLAAYEILQAPDGNHVVDLLVPAQAMAGTNATSAWLAGYAVYTNASALNRVVLFNYANTTDEAATFTLSGDIFPPQTRTNVTVKFMTASNSNETTRVSWGGQTMNGVRDGQLVDGGDANQVLDCGEGCNVRVNGSSVAVLFVGGVPAAAATPTTPDASRESGSTSEGAKVGCSLLCVAVVLCLALLSS